MKKSVCLVGDKKQLQLKVETPLEKELKIVIDVYNECLKKYLKQDEWMTRNLKKITLKQKEAFKETVGDLGDIAYLLEVTYGYKMKTLDEKLMLKNVNC